MISPQKFKKKTINSPNPEHTKEKNQTKINNQTEIECLQWYGLQSSYPSAQTAKSESELSVEKSTQARNPTIEELQTNTKSRNGVRKKFDFTYALKKPENKILFRTQNQTERDKS